MNSQYEDAIKKVQESRTASVAFLQHAMDLPHALAAEFIERMEKDGLVSKPQSNGKRGVWRPVKKSKPKPKYTDAQILGSG